MTFNMQLTVLLIVFIFSSIIDRWYNKVPFNGKTRGQRLKSHIHLIGLNFHGFVLWSLAVLFLIACTFLNFYQNYMAFWPLSSSFSVERDLKQCTYFSVGNSVIKHYKFNKKCISIFCLRLSLQYIEIQTASNNHYVHFWKYFFK